MIRPTESELQILHVLWATGPSTVREVNESLNAHPERFGRNVVEGSNEVGYTTTLKFMQIMFEKGFVTRVEDGRTHRYAAAVTEDATKNTLLQNFVDTAFRGSAMELVLQALGNHEASSAELDAVKALIAQIEQQQSQP